MFARLFDALPADGSILSFPFLCSSKFSYHLNTALKSDTPLGVNECRVLFTAWIFCKTIKPNLLLVNPNPERILGERSITKSQLLAIKQTIAQEFSELKDQLISFTALAKQRASREVLLFAEFCIPDLDPDLFKLLDSCGMNQYRVSATRSVIYIAAPMTKDEFYHEIRTKFDSANIAGLTLQDLESLIRYEQGPEFVMIQ
jgi:hypothetical protein